jgi:hypothetical protein
MWQPAFYHVEAPSSSRSRAFRRASRIFLKALLRSSTLARNIQWQRLRQRVLVLFFLEHDELTPTARRDLGAAGQAVSMACEGS